MGLNDIAVKVGKLEERMNNLESQILRELQERKETQTAMASTVNKINQKVWMATGFMVCLQIVLQVVLRYAFK